MYDSERASFLYYISYTPLVRGIKSYDRSSGCVMGSRGCGVCLIRISLSYITGPDENGRRASIAKRSNRRGKNMEFRLTGRALKCSRQFKASGEDYLCCFQSLRNRVIEALFRVFIRAPSPQQCPPRVCIFLCAALASRRMRRHSCLSRPSKDNYRFHASLSTE